MDINACASTWRRCPSRPDPAVPSGCSNDLAEELERVEISTLTAIEGERRPNLERFLDHYLDGLTRFAESVGQVHFAPVPVPRAFGFATVQE